MAVTYNSISDATLAAVLTGLETRGIGPGAVIAIEHDGTDWFAIYVIQG